MAKRKTNINAKEISRKTSLPKVAVGIQGLDDILNGGLPKGRTTLVEGGPGTGKTNLALEFLYRGALQGKAGIFISFEETADAIRQNALTMGWDLKKLEQEKKLIIIEAIPDVASIIAGDFNLKGVQAQIQHYAKSIGTDRLVVDAVDDLLGLLDNKIAERGELLNLVRWLNKQKITTILTTKITINKNQTPIYEFLDYLVDCSIRLDQKVIDQITTRRLRVIKYRGTRCGRNEYPFIISDRGIKIVPITSVLMKHKGSGAILSSGVQLFDGILGGGFRKGSCVLFSGVAGSGKTSFVCSFARSICQKGEKVLFLSFEESPTAIVREMLSVGIDLQPAITSGKLIIISMMPESQGVEEHLMTVFELIENFQPHHVIVDAISAVERMGTKQTAFDYVFRLIDVCKTKGITSLLTNMVTAIDNSREITGMELSSLIDTVILLRLIDVRGEMNRILLVMKSRGMNHLNQWREFMLTSSGVVIPDVYKGRGGILTGAARLEQEEQQKQELKKLQSEIQQQQHLIEQKKAAITAQQLQLQVELEVAEVALNVLKSQLQDRLEEQKKRNLLRGGE